MKDTNSCAFNDPLCSGCSLESIATNNGRGDTECRDTDGTVPRRCSTHDSPWAFVNSKCERAMDPTLSPLSSRTQATECHHTHACKHADAYRAEATNDDLAVWLHDTFGLTEDWPNLTDESRDFYRQAANDIRAGRYRNNSMRKQADGNEQTEPHYDDYCACVKCGATRKRSELNRAHRCERCATKKRVNVA